MELKTKQRIIGVAILIIVLAIVGVILFTSSNKPSEQEQVTSEMTAPTDQEQPSQMPTDNNSQMDQNGQPYPSDQNQPGVSTGSEENSAVNQEQPNQVPNAQQQEQSVPAGAPNSQPQQAAVPNNPNPQPDIEQQPEDGLVTPSSEVKSQPKKTVTKTTTATTTVTVKHSKTAKPAKKATGTYTVQAASFKGATNANKLQKQLKANGYDAYVKKIKTSSGSTMYRVNVGHGISRSEAKNLIAKLTKTNHLNGITAEYKK